MPIDGRVVRAGDDDDYDDDDVAKMPCYMFTLPFLPPFARPTGGRDT